MNNEHLTVTDNIKHFFARNWGQFRDFTRERANVLSIGALVFSTGCLIGLLGLGSGVVSVTGLGAAIIVLGVSTLTYGGVMVSNDNIYLKKQREFTEFYLERKRIWEYRDSQNLPKEKKPTMREIDREIDQHLATKGS